MAEEKQSTVEDSSVVLTQIEELRDQMNRAAMERSLSDPTLIEMSQRLDGLLNRYQDSRKEIGRTRCSGPACIRQVALGEERFSYGEKKFCSRSCMEAHFLGIEKGRAANAALI